MKKNLKCIMLLFLILVSSFSLLSCKSNSLENKINKILKADLNSSVTIIKLYYNEQKQGCFVEFKTESYTDKAAINLDSEIIEYKSEYDYWSRKVEELRNQSPINQSELHEYNQKIINSFYTEWNFAVTVFEANGRPEDSDWTRII